MTSLKDLLRQIFSFYFLCEENPFRFFQEMIELASKTHLIFTNIDLIVPHLSESFQALVPWKFN